MSPCWGGFPGNPLRFPGHWYHTAIGVVLAGDNSCGLGVPRVLQHLLGQSLVLVCSGCGFLSPCRPCFSEIYWPTDPYQDVHLRAELVEDVDSFIRVIGTLPEMDTRIAVHLPPEEGIGSGDTVVFSGRISEPPAAPNPGVLLQDLSLDPRSDRRLLA